jgi:short-subunit dehydrogenase
VTAVARNQARLEELMDELGPGPHEFLGLDLSTREGMDRCAERLRDGS